MTAAEAMERAIEWAEGKLSHVNELMTMEPSDHCGGPAGARQVTMALCEFADAQEVVKWSALALALTAAETAVPARVVERERIAGEWTLGAAQ